MPKQKIQISVPATLEFSSMIRRVSDEVFGYVKFSKSWANRLKLVLDELFMNAVKYGSSPTSLIYLTYEFGDGEVTFVIEDDGTGPKAVDVEHLTEIVGQNKANTELTKTSGRGLSMIVGLWTDDTQIESSEYGGIKIICTKKIDSSEPPPLASTETVEADKGAEEIVPKSPVQTVEIKLSGEIDQHNIDEKISPVNEQIQTLEPNSELVLDFGDVSYINSTFIGNLAAWVTEVKSKGSILRIQNANKDIQDVISLVGISKVLEMS